MGSGTTALVIVGVAVLAFLLFSTQLGLGAPNFIAEIQQWIAAHFGGGGSSIGKTTLGMTIFFTDGTRKDINQGTFSMLPLSIFYELKNVSSIELDVRAKLFQTATAWNAVTNVTIIYTQFGSPTSAGESNSVFPTSGLAWANGTIINLATWRIMANQLSGMIGINPMATWTMQITVNVDCTATINGVSTTMDRSVLTGSISIGATPRGFSITNGGEGLINP